MGGIAFGALYALCFVFLLNGRWIPLVPSAIAIVATGSVIRLYTSTANQLNYKKFY
jgi:CHASE2 domain-containing sensor protein